MKKPTYEELCKKYPTEKVFVIDKKECEKIKEGVDDTISKEEMLKILERGYFVYRKDAEYNPKYAQIIPYVVIKKDNEYFASLRLSGSGETRLVGKITVGMGGHINPEDEGKNKEELILNNIRRELQDEELFIDLNKTKSLEFKGFIKCHANKEDLVSLDHLGLLYVLETKDENTKIKETELLEGKFVKLSELEDLKEKSESWSKVVIEYLLKNNNRRG